MPIAHKGWVSAIPLLFLAAACGESRIPTDADAQAAQFETGVTTALQCQEQIDALRLSTGTVAISGRNADKDRAGLIGKLDEASGKLSNGKNADAVLKLNDFTAKVQSLQAAGKIAPADADALVAQANAAINCINSIGI